MSPARVSLAITGRALAADFGVPLETTLDELEELADERGGLARSFVVERGTEPEGRADDRVERLATGHVPIYILRFGKRARGLTWFDRASERCWLLAAHFLHRSGERSDSYAYFRSLSAVELKPTDADVARVEAAAQAKRALAILDVLPVALREASERPGEPIAVDLGGIPVWLTFEAALPPHVRLAIGMRRAVQPSIPTSTAILAIVTAIYGHEYGDWGDLPYASDGRPYELTFEDFVSDWPR